MKHTIENENYILEVKEDGAEICSLKHKKDGRELIWQADPKYWKRHAPFLFPYCGSLFDNTLKAKNQSAPAKQHGFARDMKFEFKGEKQGALYFELKSNDATRSLFPYEFELEVTYKLDGGKLIHGIRVKNPKDAIESLPFSVGYHPAFALPMDEGRATEDYEFAFDQPETPIVIHTPGSYLDGTTSKLFENGTSIPLHDKLFEEDSICMSELKSGSITLQPKNKSGRFLKVDIKDFPYVLLWGPSSGPLPFVCIEPWHSLPDGPDRYKEFADKPGLFKLEPGQEYYTQLVMEYGFM